MDDVVGMAVVKGLQDLLEDAGSHLLTEELHIDNAIEKLTTAAKPTKSKEKEIVRLIFK